MKQAGPTYRQCTPCLYCNQTESICRTMLNDQTCTKKQNKSDKQQTITCPYEGVEKPILCFFYCKHYHNCKLNVKKCKWKTYDTHPIIKKCFNSYLLFYCWILLNVIIVWRYHYIDVLNQELVNTKPYTSTTLSEHDLVAYHFEKCE